MGYMHTCTYICKYTYIITFTCVHTGVPPYTLTYMLLLFTSYMFKYKRNYTHARVHLYIQTNMHT